MSVNHKQIVIQGLLETESYRISHMLLSAHAWLMVTFVWEMLGCRITLVVSKCVYNLYAFEGSFAVIVALERCGEMIPGTTALQSSTMAVGYDLWDHTRTCYSPSIVPG